MFMYISYLFTIFKGFWRKTGNGTYFVFEHSKSSSTKKNGECLLFSFFELKQKQNESKKKMVKTTKKKPPRRTFFVQLMMKFDTKILHLNQPTNEGRKEPRMSEKDWEWHDIYSDEIIIKFAHINREKNIETWNKQTNKNKNSRETRMIEVKWDKRVVVCMFSGSEEWDQSSCTR